MTRRSSFCGHRSPLRVASLLLYSAPLLLAAVARAEERKFLVILANMPRSFPEEQPVAGQPPIPMPGLADIEEVFYSDSNPLGFFSGNADSDEFGSFNEYWQEISCGIVRVVGKAMGTVELPWPQYPVFEDETTTPAMVDDGDILTDWSPATQSDGNGFWDLNSVGDFQFGAGERVREDRVLYNTDFDNSAGAGDLPNPQPGTVFVENFNTVQSEDLDNDGRLDAGVEDLDGDGRFDLTNEDINQNCIMDTNLSLDDWFCGNRDGVWTPNEDCDGDGDPDFGSEDIDNDNNFDVGENPFNCPPGAGYTVNPPMDVNQDGVLSNTEDLDGDGNFDRVEEDVNANGQLDDLTYLMNPNYDPIWTPGERFRDVDNDEYYDASFEPAIAFDFNDDGVRNRFSDSQTTLRDPDDFADSNGNDRRDFPEPLEDFLVMKVTNEPGVPQFAPVSPQYLINNYPGNVPMLLKRVGNNNISKLETGRLIYDGPDTWDDIEGANRKLEQDAFEPIVPDHVTPQPDWLEDFWRARYGESSAAELMADGPGWFDFRVNSMGPPAAGGTPNLLPYEPVAEDDSTAEAIEFAFQPNRGGTGGWGTVLEQMLHLFPQRGVMGFIAIAPDPDQDGQPGVTVLNPNEGACCNTIAQTCRGIMTETQCQQLADNSGETLAFLGNGSNCVVDCLNNQNPGGQTFDYDGSGTEHSYAYLETPGIPPGDGVTVGVNDDFIFGVSPSGRSGCIMRGAASPYGPDCCAQGSCCSGPDPDPCCANGGSQETCCGVPAHTWGCDFNRDGSSDEVGQFGPPPPGGNYAPGGLPGDPGGMQDLDGDGDFDDFLFNPCDLSGHPDCVGGQPAFFPPFSFTSLFPPINPTCACIAFNVDTDGDFLADTNALCDANSGVYLPPNQDDENALPVPCFVPRCHPDADDGSPGSPFYPIPRFEAPDSASLICQTPFAIRWGDGEVLELDGPQQWPGYNAPDENDQILPPGDLLYDGPKEYDDLASSFYHTRWDPGTHYPDAPVAVLLNYGGDQALGEVTTTSPGFANRTNYGEDKSEFGSTGSGHNPDGIIIPSGPLAGGDTGYDFDGDGTFEVGPDGILDVIHGGPGFDGGNQLVLELLTRRIDGTALTEPLDGPYTPDGRGFRDFNLDGLVDLGEGREFGTENYVVDSINFTTHDGMQAAAYPFNRNRLVEDVVEATDPVEDFDTWVNNFMGCGGTRSLADISHIIYLPEGLPSTEPFAVFSPDPDALHPGGRPLNTVDDMPPQANMRVRLQDMLEGYTFTNLAASLDRNGETDQAIETNASFNVAFAAHEFGHYWECWPDLYDYDVFDGFQNEHPIASWDLMSGSAAGMVHVIPVFKENSGWIQSIDLTTVLIPGVALEVRLGPVEASCDQYYHYENRVRGVCANPSNPLDGACRQERFSFHHLEDHGEFSRLLPWDELPAESSPADGSAKNGGLMVLHSDLASNQEGIPSQQRWGSHFGYLYVQADGQHSLEKTLEAGGNVGDAGDPFPGFLNITKWNVDTNPHNRWWDTTQGTSSGIEIVDAKNELSGSTVTFLWFPQNVPSLQFLQPPGGETVNGSYPIIYRWNDEHAGTRLYLFAQPANASDDLSVDENGACSDDCYLGERLNNTAITKVAPFSSTGTRAEPVGPNQHLADGFYRFYAFLEPGSGIDNGCENAATPGPNRTCATPDYRGIASATNAGSGQLVINNLVQDVNNANSTRLESWVVSHVGFGECQGTGEWLVVGTLSGTQRVNPLNPASPPLCATTGSSFTTTNPPGALTFTVTGVDFAQGDRFSFVTTGFTAYSAPIEIVEGQVDLAPVAVIKTTTDQVPCCFPPVRIDFDGGDSVDSSGSPAGIVRYDWDLGDDGTIDKTGKTVFFDFNEDGVFKVGLTVSEGPPQFRQGSTVKSITISNNRPIASFTAEPSAGPADLAVHFSAADSFDPDGLIDKYEWDFDYQGSRECCDCPIIPDTEESDPEIDHIYTEGSFFAALRVTDADGEKSCVAFREVHSGNQKPMAAFTATPSSGPIPLNVVFDAGGSSDADADPLTYVWSFGDDSTDVTTDQPVVSHRYTGVGSFPVSLTVRDDQGAASFDTATGTIVTTLGEGSIVTIDQITAAPTSGPSPLTVQFFAVAHSPSGGELEYRWELDLLGTRKFGANITHTFINNNAEVDRLFTVKLVVTDKNSGAQDVGTRNITVRPAGSTTPGSDPNLVSEFTLVSSSGQGVAPFFAEFSTAGSRSLDGVPVTVVVDFGDAMPKQTVLPGATINHLYQEPGSYRARATTVGPMGQADSDPITIVVTESGNPVASIFADRINGVAPLTINFDGSASFDPEQQPLQYMWNFDDNTSAVGAVVAHTFNAAGTFRVVLAVSDGAGGTGTAAVQIVVDPVSGGGGGGTLPDVPDDDLDPGFEEPQLDCGAGCGTVGAAQLLLMIFGMLGLKSLRRRRE